MIRHLLFTLVVSAIVFSALPAQAQQKLKVVNNHPDLDFRFSIDYGDDASCRVAGTIRNFMIRKRATMTLQIPNEAEMLTFLVEDDHGKNYRYNYLGAEKCVYLVSKEEPTGILVVANSKGRISINPSLK